MIFKGAIFDLDGTILDSMHCFKPVGIKMRDKYKLQNVDYGAFYGCSIPEIGQILKQKHNMQETVEEFVAYSNSLVEDAFFNEVMPKENVESFLMKLKENNIVMTIATLSDRYLVEAALKRCDLLKYFSAVYCCGEIGVGKQSPEVYELARQYLGTKKDETWVFEDSLYAATTAKKAGFKVAGIFDKHSEKYHKELRNLCDVFIDDYRVAYDNIIKL